MVRGAVDALPSGNVQLYTLPQRVPHNLHFRIEFWETWFEIQQIEEASYDANLRENQQIGDGILREIDDASHASLSSDYSYGIWSTGTPWSIVEMRERLQGRRRRPFQP